MTDLSTAGTSAIDWQRVSPRHVVAEVVSSVLGGVVMTALLFIPFGISRAPWTLVFPAASLVLSIVFVALARRQVRSIGYALRGDDLLFRKGIGWQRIVSVPYGRMQLVDIERGPLARRLGLSELKLVTAAASSTISIPGIPEADADALRDRLVELAETRRAGL